jgi:hypothetical protein
MPRWWLFSTPGALNIIVLKQDAVAFCTPLLTHYVKLLVVGIVG